MQHADSSKFLAIVAVNSGVCAVDARGCAASAHADSDGRQRTTRRNAHQRMAKNEGSGRSRMVRNPGAAVNTCGMALMVSEAVAISPWMPPCTFDSRRGDPSISTESKDS